jgi:hypothetical protein
LDYYCETKGPVLEEEIMSISNKDTHMYALAFNQNLQYPLLYPDESPAIVVLVVVVVVVVVVAAG